MYTEQLSQQLSIAARIDPQTLSSAHAVSGAVDMSKFRRVMAVIEVGAGGGTILAKLQGATTSGGTYSDVASSTVNLTAAATNQQITIETSDEAFYNDEGTTYQFLKLYIGETAGTSTYVSGVVLGGEANHKPASQQDPTTVLQRLVMA